MNTSPAPAVRLDTVGATYRDGDVRALVDVGLTVGVGERVGLLGPSGSGKTTLLDVVCGLRPEATGSVEVLGVHPARLDARARRRHGRRVGSVAQDLELAAALRVIHNVNAGRLGSWGWPTALRSLVRPVGREQVSAALDTVDMADRIDAMTRELSGGERQRVAVARVVHQCPELVVADEPTSSVDPELSDRVMEVLMAVAPTTMVSLHDPTLARRHCERLIGMRDGRIVFDRPTADVDDETISALYGARRWS